MATDTNPFENLERQFKRMQRQFEELLEMWDTDRSGAPTSGVSTMGIDLTDHGDQFTLTADVPGFETDEIDLRFADDTVYIAAEREQEQTEEHAEERYLKSERTRRSMSRTVRIPEPVDEEAIEATCKNGVLTVTLPKKEPGEPDGRSIDIE
ncbi:Hsp20/alpha crystallin family protein [Natronolimnohabitans sp. A-GB9]|uniref:Hsp20/alpha crystallin family protein n=1 Tax=Natronolimnohabitans sp. A-GB9 TaxID=3069757 RepID=UPI0027B28D30|nr:Hsp20/alpha crystallin family protein [Natronolimnohabitans sp. A-GB9]MDQ2052406.1 Hsp20/alpha crystallin family protein [Natronolimnohabitans sp. A-GB9]